MPIRLRVFPFSLEDTMECGQFFRFTRSGGTYIVQSSGRIFSLWQRGETLFSEGVEEPFLIQFLRLDEDLTSIQREIDQDSVIHQAIQTYRGLRLIRQDPWECLVSYLCSSAKAIPQIRSIIEGLCKSSGRKVQFGNYIGYEFPESLCHASSSYLESIGAGFRTHYLIQTNQCIDRDQLRALRMCHYLEARERLMRIPGVGKKIADCVLLYSLDCLQAFPVDTWIKKGLQKTYFRGKKIGEKRMEQYVSRHFGPFAGYAQLYLYHFWRRHPITP